MTINGADATSTSVAALDNLGAKFVCRYLSPAANTWKNLTESEAAALIAGGIDVVSNWEYGTQDYAGGYNQGVNYAKQAEAMHLACGGPAGAPIYFSVDIDVAVDAADAYFQGIVSVLGVARVGAYASTGVLRHLKSAGLITYTWRTMSTDWNGGAGNPGEFDIVQTGYYNSNYDHDVANVADFGQWSKHGGAYVAPPSSTPPTPPPASTTYQYRASHNTQTPIAVDGAFGPASWKALQYVLGVTPDGVLGPVTVSALQTMLARYGSPAVALVVDGALGPITVKAFQEKVGVAQDGNWGSQTSTAAQTRLNAGTLWGPN